MDQASADVQTETQKPQNQKNDKNRPKHGNLLVSAGLISSAARCTCLRLASLANSAMTSEKTLVLSRVRAALLLAAVTDHSQIRDRQMTVLGVVFIHTVLLHLSLGVFLHPVSCGV